MPTDTHRGKWKAVVAFAIIYLVWGSTFLAIRIGVQQVPPFLLAAMRFVAAGFILYVWAMARSERSPRVREWLSVVLVALFMFVLDYGLLFWSEQRVPSGVAAVMLATIPVFMTVSEITLLGSRKFTVRLAVALCIGLCGVVVLVSRSLNLGGAPIDRGGAVALLVGAVTWSFASVLTRKLPLPSSKVMSSGAQMLAGGVLLTVVSAALGEFRGFHPRMVSREAWLALIYLIVAGSVVAFPAYVWLLHHESPTKVGTYAYVNPVVAVLLGYWFGGEALGARTMLGTVFVLASILVITTSGTGAAIVVSPAAKSAVAD